jgi:hypothetical protein
MQRPLSVRVGNALGNGEKVHLNNLYINPVRTSQETHYVSATEPNRTLLFRETVTVYCETHTEHTDILRVGGIMWVHVFINVH